MNDTTRLWPEGLQVRLKGDPGQVGRCTGRTKARGETIMVQVRFNGPAASMYPEYELDLVEQPVPEREALRNGSFGRAADLRRQLTHIQLSGRLANLVYSMDTTNTDFYAHQYKPVLAFLDSPSNGLLVADEVGLGKTIEAGLIWTELRARIDARRLLVVCPKMLCPKWKMELRNRFGVDARIADTTDLLEELRRPKADVTDGSALIVSMQGIRPPRSRDEDGKRKSPRHQLADFLQSSADQQALADLVVIDEAHYLRNPETSTHELGLLLRDITDHIVLLTATPINLKNEDLFSLLSIVDPENFRYAEQFQGVLNANEPLVKARLLALTPNTAASQIAREVEKARSHHLLAESKQLEALISDLNEAGRELRDSDRARIADRIERANLLSHAVTRTRKVEVTERRVVRDARVQKVEMTGEESALYSAVTQAIRAYADERGSLEGFLLAMPQRQLSSCMYAAARYWGGGSRNHSDEVLYEDLGYSDDEDRGSEFLNHLTSRLDGFIDLPALRLGDSKFNAFGEIIREFFTEYPSEKIVVFSYFRETLRYLHERLQELGIHSIVLMGSPDLDKTAVIEQFRSEPSIRILLSSEVASEGVDLQFSRFLINYDLPWNPMKVEQRIGRLDRLGQAAEKIFVWNLVYEDTIDSRILTRLYERLDLFERALGGMEAVLGEEIQHLTRDLLTGRLTREEEEERISRTALALENRRRSEDELERQASQLIAHSGYILQKIHAAHEFSRRITEYDLITYVRDYLNRYAIGHVFHQPGEDDTVVDIKLPPSVAAKLDEFLKRRRLTGLTALATGQIQRCQFLNKVQKSASAAEVISQFHPFTRFIAQELDVDAEKSVALICVRLPITTRSSVRLEAGLYVGAVHRWFFEGIRTEEILRARVIRLSSEELLEPDASLAVINSARLDGRDWLEAANDLEVEPSIQAMDEAEFALISDFEEERDVKEAENGDRITFQRDSIAKHLDRRLDIERRRVASLVGEPRGRGLIIAAERKMKLLQDRFDVQMASLQQKEKVMARYDLVCRCVIQVQ